MNNNKLITPKTEYSQKQRKIEKASQLEAIQSPAMMPRIKVFS